MEHGNIDYDKSAPNSKGLIVFLVLFILGLGLSVAGIFYLTKTSKDYVAMAGLNRLGIPYEVEQLRTYEQRMLNEYGVIDAEKGIYRIPIDEAMDKVIRDYR